MVELSNEQFVKYSMLINENIGIQVKTSKKPLIQSRLQKVMRSTGINDYDVLYRYLTENSQQEGWSEFTHHITTHKTDFFREKGHFDFIVQELDYILKKNPRIKAKREIRVWSAGCSTGEEPYTITMVLHEYLPPEIKVKILATDISNRVIDQAQKGVYLADSEEEIGLYLIEKYFRKEEGRLKILPEIKELVTFRTFNLIAPFPFKDYFDIVFCRNVMIYFDLLVQEQLIKKFYDILVPGGLFFVGHSEGLANKHRQFKYIRPTIYMK